MFGFKNTLSVSKWLISLIVLVMLVLGTNAFASQKNDNAIKLVTATATAGGFYNNGLFTFFGKALRRASRGKYDVVRYAAEGTDGTIDNIELVAKGSANGGADIAFIQRGGLALNPSPEIKEVGIVMYELAHLVVAKKGRVDSVKDLESKKKYSVGYNSLSGSAVTWEVFGKVDEDYLRATRADILEVTTAISMLGSGQLDSFFFVSVPNTVDVRRVIGSHDVEFAPVWDGDFDEFEVNGRQLYSKIKVSKKNGYDRTFKSVAVPCSVIVNARFAEEHRGLFNYLFDATLNSYNTIKTIKRFTYYPDN